MQRAVGIGSVGFFDTVSCPYEVRETTVANEWRSVLATALAVLTIGGALLIGAPASGASGSPKAKGLTALIVKQAHNPVLRALRSNHALKTDRTSGPPGSVSKPSRYSLLIVDGDNLGAKALAKRRELRRFSAGRRWILAFDVQRPHFVKAIGKNTGFSTRAKQAGKSRVFLYRRTMDGATPLVQMIEARSLAPAGSGHFSKRERRRLARQEASRVAEMVQTAVSGGGPAAARLQRPEAQDPAPAELQQVEWQFTETGSASPPDGFWSYHNQEYAPRGGITAVPNPGSQTASWTMTHTFHVYLQNGGGKATTGSGQVVTYELDGAFSPRTPNGSFFQMYNPFRAVFDPTKHFERAWWTGRIGSTVSPVGPTGSELIFQASEPQTPNADTSYSTSDSFEVGFSASHEGAELDGKYAVKTGKSYSIDDWGVENASSLNNLNWLFSARRPCDARDNHYDENSCFDVGFGKDALPNLPSDLSLNQIQVHTSGRWQTTAAHGPETGNMSFKVGTPVQLEDTWCQIWPAAGIPPACQPDARHLATTAVGPPGNTYTFDAGAVIPIPIASLTMQPKNADGAKTEKVIGTVTLTKPASIDTQVVVYSNSGNALVGAPINGGKGSQTTVTIPKGQATGTFVVQTNDNELKPNGHTAAAITAFYAAATTTQLRIHN
jgi:hypothetical protein